MRQAQLQKTLGDLVTDFGYETVRKTLGKMHAAKLTPVSHRAKPGDVGGTNSAQKLNKKSHKPNAIKCIQSLAIVDTEKNEILATLAEKYEAKEFMPNVNHVREFLFDGERDVLRIKSRQQVTVVVFKKLATLETEKLQEMLDRGLYGSPKRLESYARAIEGFRRPLRSEQNQIAR